MLIAIHYFVSRCEKTLDKMWIVRESDQKGYFCHQPTWTETKFAFTNFGVSYGLQSVNLWPERVVMLNNFFEDYKSEDEYDTKSITHVMYLNSVIPGIYLNSYNK